MLTVARALIGKLLVRRIEAAPDAPPRFLVARLVEVEAYGGKLDRASHSFRGPTPRCAAMFGPSGRLYVYFTYGAHFCVNVVAGSRREAAAVLLRAAEPWRTDDEDLAWLRAGRMARARPGATAQRLAAGTLDHVLLRGPGNLAAGLRLDRQHDGMQLTRGDGPLWIAAGNAVRRVAWTPRIGLGDYPAARWNWRVIDGDSDATTPTPSNWPSHRSPRPTLARVRAAATRAQAAINRAAAP